MVPVWMRMMPLDPPCSCPWCLRAGSVLWGMRRQTMFYVCFLMWAAFSGLYALCCVLFLAILPLQFFNLQLPRRLWVMSDRDFYSYFTEEPEAQRKCSLLWIIMGRKFMSPDYEFSHFPLYRIALYLLGFIWERSYTHNWLQGKAIKENCGGPGIKTILLIWSRGAFRGLFLISPIETGKNGTEQFFYFFQSQGCLLLIHIYTALIPLVFWWSTSFIHGTNIYWTLLSVTILMMDSETLLWQ